MRKFSFRNRVIASLVILLGIFPFAHIVILNSDAYAVAKQFVLSSPEVLSVAGAVIETSIPMIGPTIEFYGSRGSAEIDFEVVGEQSEVVVMTSLEKRGTWRVVRATLVDEFGIGVDIEVPPANHSLKADGPDGPRL